MKKIIDKLKDKKKLTWFIVLLIIIIWFWYYYSNLQTTKNNKSFYANKINKRHIVQNKNNNIKSNDSKKNNGNVENNNTGLLFELWKIFKKVNCQNKLDNKFVITKQDSNEKFIKDLSWENIISIKDLKQYPNNKVINNFISSPLFIIKYLSNFNNLTNIISNIPYTANTDLLLNTSDINKVLNKYDYKITDIKFTITNYQKNKEINMLFHIVAINIKQNIKIKINWWIIINFNKKTILIKNLKILKLKKFKKILDLSVNKYLITLNWLQSINGNWKIYNYLISMDYDKWNINKFVIKRQLDWKLKLVFFKMINKN